MRGLSTSSSEAPGRRDSGAPRTGGGTRRLAIGLVAALVLVVGVSAGAFVSFAGAASFVFVPDQGGENDIDTSSLGNQSDLSALGVLGNQYGWKWDEAALSGGNTQDVCVYFSTNGADGTAERAICYQIVSDAAGNVASDELTYWQCPPGTYSSRHSPLIPISTHRSSLRWRRRST